MTKHLIGAMLILVALTASARGADQATGGTTTGPDVSTPSGAQKAALIATNKEDEKGVRKFLQATTPTEEKLADAMAANAVAGAKVYNAAVKKFGEDTTRKELIGLIPMQSSEKEIDAVQWKIDGDKATPVEAGGQKFVGAGLKKVDGVWKLSISDLAAGHPEGELKQMMGLIEKQSAMMNDTAKETTDGKYATVQDLKSATIDKMRKLMQEAQAMAATQTTQAAPPAPPAKPATAPAPTPGSNGGK
jgi:hypothetical protein